MEAWQRVKLSLTNRSIGLISSFHERRAQQQACAEDTSSPSQNLTSIVEDRKGRPSGRPFRVPKAWRAGLRHQQSWLRTPEEVPKKRSRTVL